MKFDPNNPIIQLCHQAMILENEGKSNEALLICMRAWNESKNDFEKFTAAHYLARHQNSVSNKLMWDEKALALALNITDQDVRGSFPSLYLNVGKCYEDLKDNANAQRNYQLGKEFTGFLGEDGYGNMIKSGIENGLHRVKTVV
jgi:hypothetical protein